MATLTKRRKSSNRRAPRKMTKADICNVEPVTSKELFEVTRLLAVCWAGKRENVDNQRWTVVGKEVGR